MTDYQEVYITGTDSTKYDSVIEGVRDADIDSDEDGLANIYEIENGTDPLSKDTDNDGLTDYDEIFIYNTNSVIPDTDGDGLEDGDELHIGVDPTNPETFGFPDIEYSIQQQITADSELFSEINIEENPYELSIDLKTNGYAEGNLYVSESGYSSVIDNEAMLGFSTDIEMNDIYNPENIVLKYKIKDNYIDNAPGIYSDYEEFQGIKRLNVFKFNEDTNMLLPVETKFDIENNTLYAEVDEFGTYCIMDMEIWLNSLGINVPEESVSEENSILKKSSNQSTSSWTPEYTNAPIDLVFLIDSSGKYKNEFEQEKNIVINFCKYVFDNYNNIRVHIITSTSYSSDVINSNNGINWFTSYDEVKTALNSINYTYDNSTLESNNKFTKVLNDVTLRNGSDIFIYSLYNHGYFRSSNSDLGSLAFCKMNIGIYSEILPKGWYYKDLNYQKDVETAINNNNGLFIELDENTLHSIISNFNENLSPFRPVYEILLPTNWKKITLNGELSPTNNIDTDGDSLTDWQEVDTSRLIWNEDGSFEIPTLSVVDIVSTMSRYQDAKYNYLFEKAPKQRFLPIISDPTMKDSDNDGISDYDETVGVSYTAPDGKVNDYKGEPLKEGLANGITGRLTLISCHDGKKPCIDGHAFFIYTSYINDTLNFSTFSYGWSRIDNTESWSAENIQEDVPTQANYNINIEESVTMGLGALDKSTMSSSTKNGFNYNMEVYKHFDKEYGYSYDTNAYIYQDIKENELYKLINYCTDNSENYWNPIHNCSSLACKTWNFISKNKVHSHNIFYFFGIPSTPKGLYKYLEQTENSSKNYAFCSQFQ